MKAALLLMLALASCPAAADPLPCSRQPGEFGFLLCEHRHEVRTFCEAMAPAVQDHCRACWLANHPLPCSVMVRADGARCRGVQAALASCGNGRRDRFSACAERVWAAHLVSHNHRRPP